MSIPPVEERQNYFMWAYAHVSFRQVVDACRFIIAPPTPLPEGVWRILFTGIVVSYARPFTKCYGAKTLPTKIIPKEDLEFHKAIMDARHKASAHIDALSYQADDPQIGNINQVRVTFTKTDHTLSIIQANLEVSSISRLSSQLLEKAEYHAEKFRRKYISNAALPPGTYKLNLDPNIQKLFCSVENL
jgi:hypothetical protein